MFNDLTTTDWHLYDLERKLIFTFRMNVTPLSIIAVEFQEDRQLGEWRKIYHSVLKRSGNIISQNEH